MSGVRVEGLKTGIYDTKWQRYTILSRVDRQEHVTLLDPKQMSQTIVD